MDASAFTADALAAAAADGDRVCLTNLVVRHRKRRGSKLFFARASAEAGWDVQLSFMTRRGETHDDADTSARLSPEAHAAAYEGCAPGATVAKVWGALERVRGVAAETVATLRVDRAAFASASPAPPSDSEDCWLVFDMAYDGSMTDGERGALSRQVTMCVAANGRARVPFRVAVVGEANAPRALVGRDAGDGEKHDSRARDVSAEDRSATRVSRVGAGAGATGEGNRVDPESFPNANSTHGSSRGPRTRPKSVCWRALPWRAWGAPRFAPGAFFAAAFHARAAPRGARGAAAAEGGAKPKKTRVVYLSADAEEVLETIEPGDVFVLGGVVDHAPKPELARRRFESLREAFFRGNTDARAELEPDPEAEVAFVTLRLPLAGHVSLAKNAHLPCLAVAQTLMVFRQVMGDRSTGTSARDAEGERRAPASRARTKAWPEKEGGANASAWGETLARCPAFRCAPLRKYVRWAPPYETLNEKEGEVKPSRVTDVTALMRDSRVC